MVSTGWHGFSSFIAFAKATFWLGGVIATILWAMLTWALDGRYASSAIKESVEQNAEVAKAVTKQLGEVQDQLTELRAQGIQDQIFETRIRQCNATSAESRQFLTERIADLSDQYIDVEEKRPFVPSCDDLQ